MGRLILFILAFAAVSPYHGGDCQTITFDLASFFQALSDFFLSYFFRPPPTFSPTTTTTPTTTSTTTRPITTTTTPTTTSTTTTSTTTPTTSSTTTTPTTTTTTTSTTTRPITTTTTPTRTSTTTTTPTTSTTTVSPNACGQSTRSLSENRIVGGSVTPPGVLRWQAALLNRLGGNVDNNFFCGASLITRRHAMSAAHCTIGRTTSNTVVRLGENDFYSTTESPHIDFSVIFIRNHPFYNARTSDNDISILVLATQAPLGPFIGLICLPSASTNFDRLSAVVSGWGATESQRVSPKLRDVTVPVVPNTQCRASYPTLTDNMICAGATGKDSCQGDSGGPMAVKVDGRWVLTGVVSYGIGCGLQGYPGVYTRVSRYLVWISANTPET